MPLPSAIARSAIPARASRVRRMPARNATGMNASEISATCSSHSPADSLNALTMPPATSAASASRVKRYTGPTTRRSGGVAAR